MLTETNTEIKSKNIGTFTPAKQETGSFNYNKLLACLCMAASAAISISLIIWAIKAFE